MFDIYNSVFTILRKYRYCVLRNADGLPYDNSSNDIDLLVEEEDFSQILHEIKYELKRLSYSRVEVSEFYGIRCYTFYSFNDELEPVKLDFFFDYSGGGIRYLTFEELYKNTIENSNEIRVLSTEFETFLTVMKTFLSGGKLKVKYQKLLINNDISIFIKQFSHFGSIISDIEFCRTKKINLQGNRSKYFKQLLSMNVKKFGLVSTTQNLINHLFTEVKRISSNNRFIAVAGIDGSGKSTLIDEVIKRSPSYFKSISGRFILEHHRPRVMPHVSDLLNRNKSTIDKENNLENPRTGKQSSALISYLKFLYYVLDYSVFFRIKHANHFRRDKIVVYDRYFFDFLVDQERSALKLNEKIVKMVYKLGVPKPSRTIYITVQPEDAVSRKGELSLADATLLQSKYLKSKEYWSKHDVINNDVLEESIQSLRNSIITAISINIDDIK